MKNVKTANIILIILVIIVVAGFVMLFTRKQTLTMNGETIPLKSAWGGKKSIAPAPADEKKAA